VVRDPKGDLLLVVSDEKPEDVAAEIVAWLFVAGILMILAALAFRAAASPGIIGGDKGHYHLWSAIGFHPVGEVACSSEEEQQVWIGVNDDGAAVTDERLLLGLAAVVLVS
jgi:hypothetical protein